MAFQGRLCAGVGKALRLYEIGKKKLLRKVETKTFGSAIVTLNTQGSRIIVGDMQESVVLAVYKAPENRLLIFADDSQPRWTTATVMVDYMTIAAGDKFGAAGEAIGVAQLDSRRARDAAPALAGAIELGADDALAWLSYWRSAGFIPQ